ncbi:MAG: heparinase II/III family protein [Firmicutes bacterium]|nr:heparinase II/III family protein [Bacillota bacterium]
MGRVKGCRLPQKLGLLIRTVRDLKFSQVFFRLVFMGKRRWRSWFGVKAKAERLNLNPTLIQLWAPLKPGEILLRAEAVLKKELTFLNRTVVFDGVADWDCPGASRLWRFNLHYMGWALELAAAYELTGDSRFLDGFIRWIRSWMAGHGKQTGDAWHPYPVSARTVNWVLAAGKVWRGLAREDAPPGYVEFREEWLGLLRVHLKYLAKNLEYDLRGNHLLANCKALLLGGIFLGACGAGAAFYRRGCRILESQLREQILSRGGHFERSPMYHCLVLEDLLILYEAFGQARLEPPPPLKSAIQRMARFLRGMLLPDGGFPLFNDSVFKASLPPAALLQWVERLFGPLQPEPRRSFLDTETGYARLQLESDAVVIFNCGAPGPGYQPGHAHADTLGFEWSLADGTRVLVDSGVDEYQAGPWRDYFRSTKAHNAMMIDGANSTEVWDSFRAGRKARVLQAGLSESDGATHAFAEHDGYRFLPGRPLHRRDLWLIKGDILLVLDTVRGSGRHRLEAGFHFHPVWRVVQVAGNMVYVIEKKRRFILKALEEGVITIHRGQLAPVRGWYAPEFGKRVPLDCISWERLMELPAWAGFICHPAELEVKVEVSEGNIELEVNQAHYSLRIKEV